MHELGRCVQHQPEHCRLFVPRRVEEAAVDPVAGVVHQDRRRTTHLVDDGRQLRCGIGRTQVQRQRGCADPGAALKRHRELPQPRSTARHEEQVVPVSGENLRKRRAET